MPDRPSWNASGVLAGACALVFILSMVGGVILPSGAAASELYASNHSLNTIAPFAIGADGSLGPIGCAGTSCNAGSGPVGVAVSPNGRSVYTADFGSDSVSAFSVAVDGALTPIACAGCSAGYEAFGIAVSPGGQFLYTSDFGAGAVSAFAIASDGSLTPIACPAAACTTGEGPTGVAVSSNGRFLYTANEGSNSVSAFSIAADGSLSPITCATGCATGGSPLGLAVSPNGQFLYAVDSGSDRLSPFSIAANGSLSPISCPGCSTASGPYDVAVSPDGQFLYTIDRGSSSLSAFSIAADGSLSPITCANCTTGMEPEGVAVSPSGQLLYTVNHSGSVSPFSIAADGAPSPIMCSIADCSVGLGPDFQSVAIAPDQAPVASFAALPAPAGKPSRFDGSASSASPGQTMARYSWSFGDGATAASAAPSAVHTYAKPGIYTVSLTVTDNAGCSTQMTFTGQTVSCNGSPAARKSEQIIVAKGRPAPAISKVGESAKLWQEGTNRHRGLRTGTTFSFTLNEPARVRFTFIRHAIGRKVGSRCVASTSHNGRRPPCPRALAAGGLTFTAHHGANKIHFAGRLSRTSTLGPGQYTLVITARDATGRRSPPRAISFVIG